MKRVLQQRDGYSLYLTINSIGDMHHVKFETLYAEAKMPDQPYTKLEMFLSTHELELLETYISNYIEHGG
ncbi:MAG: hypothetical protein EBV10_02500 [Synechococcaceae bacterium WB6_1A_059]|nr:hypothetical protein [Synechococcaceae bacterium WB6_1A_059]